jgi:hypothetical protein
MPGPRKPHLCPPPPANGVDKMYHQLVDIHGLATACCTTSRVRPLASV